MFDADFLDLMPDKVTIFNQVARDAWGDSTYVATGTVWRAHVSYKTKRVLSETGQDQTIAATVILAGVPATLDPEDKVVLPDGKTRKIVTMDTYHDEEGPHHVTLGVV